MNRPFRPRPLDIHKRLLIVKSVKDLDNDDGSGVSRAILHGHNGGIPGIEPRQANATKQSAGEIPTPQFVFVESYERDYSRTFSQPSSYVRGRGTRSGATEYDLDDEDEDWLQHFDNDGTVLFAESLEWMLFKMELLDHKAREWAGGMPAIFGVPTPVLLPQEGAIEALQYYTPRSIVASAVYEYWKLKRGRWKKPILRCLQPTPSVNDTNPFNVFRPREKLHRPHTRRVQRHENDVQSFKKLRRVHCNLEQTRTLLQALQKREEKKQEVMDSEVNLQRIWITAKHDWVLDDEVGMDTSSGIDTPHLHKTLSFKKDDVQGSMSRTTFSVVTPDLVNGQVRIRPATNLTPCVSDGALMMVNGDECKCKMKRRVHQQCGLPSKRITTLEFMEPTLLFTKPMDPENLAAAGIVPPLDLSVPGSPACFQGRIGRGGRIIFDRWNPLTHLPIRL